VREDHDPIRRQLLQLGIESSLEARTASRQLSLDQGLWIDPAGLGEPDAARSDRHAGMRRSLFTRRGLRVLRRQAGDRLLLRGALALVARAAAGRTGPSAGFRGASSGSGNEESPSG